MINWGVIGLGRIAHRFVESLAHFDDAQFYAGGSRNPDKRNEFKELYHPKKLYADYVQLLNDPEIDVVYIALPHAFHYQWCLESLKHGKHVLVEKPATLNSQELIELTTYAKEHQLFFMEAMKTRFIPLVNLIHNEINKGQIGQINKMMNHFTYEMPYDENHYLFDSKQGGALYDVGPYCIASLLDYAQSPIKDISGTIRFAHGVDTSNIIKIEFENGIEGIFEAAIDTASNREMVIEGSLGKIVFTPFYRPEEAIVYLNNGDMYKIQQEIPFDDFYPEISEVHQGIKNNRVESPKMTHQDSINIVKLMEKIKDI